MATKKKRSKRYSGVDAKTTPESVTKITVPDRSKLGKWWYENKSKIRTRTALIGVLVGSYLIINWLLRAIF